MGPGACPLVLFDGFEKLLRFYEQVEKARVVPGSVLDAFTIIVLFGLHFLQSRNRKPGFQQKPRDLEPGQGC